MPSMVRPDESLRGESIICRIFFQPYPPLPACFISALELPMILPPTGWRRWGRLRNWPQIPPVRELVGCRAQLSAKKKNRPFSPLEKNFFDPNNPSRRPPPYPRIYYTKDPETLENCKGGSKDRERCPPANIEMYRGTGSWPNPRCPQ